MKGNTISSDEEQKKLENLERILDELHTKETRLVRKKISILKNITKKTKELNCIKEKLITNKIQQLNIRKDMIQYKSQEHELIKANNNNEFIDLT